MKYQSEHGFTHPVLSPESDHYSNGQFTTKLSRPEPADGQVRIILDFSLQETYLEQLVRDSKPRCVAMLYCRATMRQQTLQADLGPLNQAELQNDTTDSANAPLLRAALPAIMAAKAADHRLWASVNCFALLPYTPQRWNQSASPKAPRRASEEKKLREWDQEHYLGHGVDIKRWNAAARLWWLTEIANRAASHSKHSAERLLSAMANDVEMYHQLLARPYLSSNARLVALIYDLALAAGNDYLFKRPYSKRT